MRFADFHQNFGIRIGQQLHELLDCFTRQNGFDTAVKLNFGVIVAAGQAVTVGGNGAHLLVLNNQQHAVEVVADVLLSHGKVHHLQQMLQILSWHLEACAHFGCVEFWVVLRRQL